MWWKEFRWSGKCHQLFPLKKHASGFYWNLVKMNKSCNSWKTSVVQFELCIFIASELPVSQKFTRSKVSRLMYFLCWIVGESPPRAFFCYKKVIKQHPRHLWHLNDLLDPIRILQDLSLYLSSKSIREEKQENSQKFPSLSSTNFASQSG